MPMPFSTPTLVSLLAGPNSLTLHMPTTAKSTSRLGRGITLPTSPGRYSGVGWAGKLRMLVWAVGAVSRMRRKVRKLEGSVWWVEMARCVCLVCCCILSRRSRSLKDRIRLGSKHDRSGVFLFFTCGHSGTYLFVYIFYFALHLRSLLKSVARQHKHSPWHYSAPTSNSPAS